MSASRVVLELAPLLDHSSQPSLSKAVKNT